MSPYDELLDVVVKKTINNVPIRIHSYVDESSSDCYFIMLESEIVVCINPKADSVQFFTKNDQDVYVQIEEMNCYRPTKRHMQLQLNSGELFSLSSIKSVENGLKQEETIHFGRDSRNYFRLDYLLKD